MTPFSKGELLIRDLLDDPQGFHERGGTYNLLQEYFAGLPIETLRALLRSDDPWIQRAGSFVAAELGGQAEPLLDDVVPLLESEDPHVQDYAMQVLTVCCEGDRAELFGLVVKKLESEHQGLQWEAMNLIANAGVEQLEAAARFLRGLPEGERHRGGLAALVAATQITNDEIEAMLQNPDPLIQRYGAIAKKRLERIPSSTRP